MSDPVFVEFNDTPDATGLGRLTVNGKYYGLPAAAVRWLAQRDALVTEVSSERDRLAREQQRWKEHADALGQRINHIICCARSGGGDVGSLEEAWNAIAGERNQLRERLGTLASAVCALAAAREQNPSDFARMPTYIKQLHEALFRAAELPVPQAQRQSIADADADLLWFERNVFPTLPPMTREAARQKLVAAHAARAIAEVQQEPASPELNETEYPNLTAMLNGRVSGHWTEWPAMRAELRRLIDAMEARFPGDGLLYLGGTYETQGGERVTMVKINNAGTSYETLVDEHGVNRYSRRASDSGRATGSAHDYSEPKNIKRPFRCLALRDIRQDVAPNQRRAAFEECAQMCDEAWRFYEPPYTCIETRVAVACFKDMAQRLRARSAAPPTHVCVRTKDVSRVVELIEDLKRECGDNPESPQAIRNGRYMSIALVMRGWLAAAQEGKR